MRLSSTSTAVTLKTTTMRRVLKRKTNNTSCTHKRMMTTTIHIKDKVRLQLLFINHYIEPMLFVDVNLGNSGNKRIVVYEGDTAEGCAEKFA